MSEFWRLMDEEFGAAYARVLADHQVLSELGGTPSHALDRGMDPRRVWVALCEAMDVPPERRWGKERPVRPRARDRYVD